eukprot:TRINITY_DN11616_c0_g1_i1.p1 TRINITY_DN11616_c0_g1~~TRINITY_DN11616_c0_g1_i1.p1  ORF type:complete len:202 (+),score=37.99 TRINITY_DN11616_c0_g1_i1:81-686(+)
MPPETVNLINEGIVGAEELDRVYAKLLANPGWRVYKTKSAVRKVDAWVMREEMPQRLVFLKSLMKLLCDMAKGRLGRDEGKLIPIQLFICHYENGADSCPLHRHDCKQVTLSLGNPRKMLIEGQPQVLRHGDATFLSREQHSIPKEPPSPVNAPLRFASRISLNFFYTTTSNPTASVTPRNPKRPRAPEDTPNETLRRRLQ